MKTKKKTTVLLVLVIMVWSAIGVRAFVLLNPEMPETEQKEFSVNMDYKVDTEIDTFSLSKLDRDPFLGTMLKKKTIKKKIKSAPVLKWKAVQYQGLVQQKKSKEKIFIVSINGRQHLMKQGQIRDSLKLLNGNSKQVTFRYGNRTKSFELIK